MSHLLPFDSAFLEVCTVCVYAATVDRLIMYESHCGKFFRFFKISFFKYGIFEIVMLIELGLTSLVFNGSKYRQSYYIVCPSVRYMLQLLQSTTRLDLCH